MLFVTLLNKWLLIIHWSVLYPTPRTSFPSAAARCGRDKKNDEKDKEQEETIWTIHLLRAKHDSRTTAASTDGVFSLWLATLRIHHYLPMQGCVE